MSMGKTNSFRAYVPPPPPWMYMSIWHMTFTAILKKFKSPCSVLIHEFTMPIRNAFTPFELIKLGCLLMPCAHTQSMVQGAPKTHVNYDHVSAFHSPYLAIIYLISSSLKLINICRINFPTNCSKLLHNHLQVVDIFWQQFQDNVP